MASYTTLASRSGSDDDAGRLFLCTARRTILALALALRSRPHGGRVVCRCNRANLLSGDELAVMLEGARLAPAGVVDFDEAAGQGMVMKWSTER